MSSILIRLLVLLLVFVTVFVVSQLVVNRYLNRRAETKAVNRRMELLKSGISSVQVDEILRKGVPTRLGSNPGMIDRLYYRFQCAVQVADVKYEARAIVFGAVVAFVAVGSLLLMLAWSSGFAISFGVVQLILVVSAGLCFGVPIAFIYRRKEKRRRRMEQQFPIALDVFTRALRAGHPIASAIELLTKEMEDPLGSEFGIVADEVSYGADLTTSLMEMANRWQLADIRMFAVSISLQNETGGNLAEILGNLSGVIRERASMYMKVRALSSEGRMSAWVLSVLPVLTFLSMFMVNASFYFSIAGDPIFKYGFGGLLLLYLIGVLIMRRMIDLKV
jgi:tight adherence protein B